MPPTTTSATSNSARQNGKPVSKVPNKVFSYEDILARAGQNGVSYTILDKVVYDMSDFLESGVHPGGVVARLAAGRDGTRLLDSYHPGTSGAKVNSYIKAHLKPVGRFEGKLMEDDLSDQNKLESSKFMDTVRERVETYLDKHKMGRHAELIGITEVVLTLSVFLFLVYYKATTGSIWAAVLNGLVVGRMGFLMHMGCHGGMSRFPLVNRLTGHLMDLAGGSSVNWSFDHQIAHHLDPNVYEMDNDTKVGNPLVRLHADTPRKWWHKTQHIHTFILMSGGFLTWYIQDVTNFLAGAVGSSTFYASKKDWIVLIGFKLWFLVMHVGLPMYYGHSFGRSLAMLATFMGVGAMYLENTFIVNHIQKGLVPPAKCHWGIKQVLGSANWQAGSHVFNWVSGGLNHQIEHHLFPAISHHYYPYLSPIVAQTCEEFGIKYRNYPTFAAAFTDLRSYLYELGHFDEIKED